MNNFFDDNFHVLAGLFLFLLVIVFMIFMINEVHNDCEQLISTMCEIVEVSLK